MVKIESYHLLAAHLLYTDWLEDGVHVNVNVSVDVVVDNVLVLGDVGGGVGVQDGVDRARGE